LWALLYGRSWSAVQEQPPQGAGGAVGGGDVEAARPAALLCDGRPAYPLPPPQLAVVLQPDAHVDLGRVGW
jgi:hypothetical protein